MSHHYLHFRGVHYRYPGGYEALKGVSFSLVHGEKVALLGANGAGKSTLALHCNGLLMPTEGQVNVGGIPVERKTLPLIRQSVGLVFQNPDDQLFMPTVEEDVAFGPLNMRLPQQEVAHRVEQALQAVGALALRKQSCACLSGGQKRRVAIATVLSMQPNVLVMDEPTSNLDPRARRQLIELLEGFGHTCLIATHDLDMVRRLCSRALVMADGRMIADLSVTDLFADHALLQRAGLE